jgi:hypothetical protein
MQEQDARAEFVNGLPPPLQQQVNTALMRRAELGLTVLVFLPVFVLTVLMFRTELVLTVVAVFVLSSFLLY